MSDIVSRRTFQAGDASSHFVRKDEYGQPDASDQD